MARGQLHHRPRGNLPLPQLNARIPAPLAFREALEDDEAFLRALFAQSAAAPVGVGGDHLAALQYDARRRDFAARFPQAVDAIVLLRGEAVGRLWMASVSQPWRILDLVVAADRRGRGIGSAVLTALLAEAAAVEAEVALSVELRNEGAVRLYRRLGFEQAGADAVHLAMLHRPSELSSG